ncbi:MAG: VOC family protein [Planctomycetota bacterium]
MAARIVPCLWFDDQAEEAARLYSGLLPGGRILGASRYPESCDNPSQKPRGSVMTVEFELAGQPFTALNGGPLFTPNPSVSFFLYAERADEVDRVYAALEPGGKALMPLGSYPWSERYGWIQDRFGISWQVMLRRSPDDPAVAPSLMFADARFGQAAQALETYARVFSGEVTLLDRYPESMGVPGDAIAHGRCVVDGQTLTAMDAPGEHGFAFSEAISLAVHCADQAEVDRLWEALGEGGEHGPCGWLKDRFGLSWQVTPASMLSRILSEDSAAKDRAFQAMLGMSKLDLAALDAAYAGDC